MLENAIPLIQTLRLHKRITKSVQRGYTNFTVRLEHLACATQGYALIFGEFALKIDVC